MYDQETVAIIERTLTYSKHILFCSFCSRTSRSYEEKAYTPPAKIAISTRCLTLSILLRKRAIFLPKFKERPYSASLNCRHIVDILWCLSELEAFQLDCRLQWIKEFYRTTFLLNLCKLIWLPTFHGDLLDSFGDRLDFEDKFHR